MKRKNSGFTLIELLAVIVILGLLMAIAIPSVTKYITQSRKKTVATTIGNYMGALTNQVNDMEYVFTGTNTIYAVPIECIALERGGTNPFGHWLHANSKYWAYVLVQYDDSSSSYTYGFTFKDSAGYGLYPTTSEKIKESGSQIQTDLSLNKPVTGNIVNVTDKANWNGFNVDDNTQVHVLEAAADGVQGNGSTTCTLCQKGSNYEEVKNQNNVVNKVSTLAGTTWKFNEHISGYEFFNNFAGTNDYGNFPSNCIMTDGNYSFEMYYFRSGSGFGVSAFGPHHNMTNPHVFWYIPSNNINVPSSWYKVDKNTENKFWSGNFSSVDELIPGFEPMNPPTVIFSTTTNNVLENSQFINWMYENAVMQ